MDLCFSFSWLGGCDICVQGPTIGAEPAGISLMVKMNSKKSLVTPRNGSFSVPYFHLEKRGVAKHKTIVLWDRLGHG